MVVIIEPNATKEQVENVVKHLEEYGFQIHKSVGVQSTIIGAIGVKPDFDTRKIKILEGVADVYRVTAPFKLASRNFHELDTVIDIKGVKIGGNNLAVMAGPCSIESEEER